MDRVTTKTIIARHKPLVIQSKGSVQLNTELASPIGIVGSFTHSMAKRPRTRMIASECISIMPDGTRKLFAKASYAQTPSKSAARPTVQRISKRAQVDIALMQGMPSIHAA